MFSYEFNISILIFSQLLLMTVIQARLFFIIFITKLLVFVVSCELYIHSFFFLYKRVFIRYVSYFQNAINNDVSA